MLNIVDYCRKMIYLMFLNNLKGGGVLYLNANSEFKRLF